jgi:hypothetical protein
MREDSRWRETFLGIGLRKSPLLAHTSRRHGGVAQFSGLCGLLASRAADTDYHTAAEVDMLCVQD